MQKKLKQPEFLAGNYYFDLLFSQRQPNLLLCKVFKVNIECG